MSAAATWDDVRRLLEQALSEVADGEDATGTISLALDTHRVLFGEMDPSEIAVWERRCICPPEQLARGGYKGGCPQHGVGHPGRITGATS